jgi:membrane protease YdiL (CAAX protease family)
MASDQGPVQSVPANDAFAAALRGFGPLGLLAIVIVLLPGNVGTLGGVFVPVSAILALAWTRLSRTPLRALGFVRPRSWVATVVLGVALGVGLKMLMKAVVMPLLGAPPVNAAFHYLAGNTPAIAAAAVGVVVAAGFGEETTFRGFAFERLGKLLGGSLPAKVAIVLITSAAFALAHWISQGPAGMQQAAVVGLVLGSIFAATGEIWLPMVAHAAFDLTALAIIYFDVEAQAAHLVFR